MDKHLILPLLGLCLACSSSSRVSGPLEEGEEVAISADELEPLGRFFLETRRILVADFVKIDMTPQFFEERMGFTRDLRYVERSNERLEDGTRLIILANISEQETNIDPDLLPRVYFGTGLEVRAYREIRIYMRWPKTRERPLHISIVAKSDPGDALLFVGGREEYKQPTIRIQSALLWSEDKEEYVHQSTIG